MSHGAGERLTMKTTKIVREHYGIIDPLRFERSVFKPYGAVDHPIMGPVDLYWEKRSPPGTSGSGASSWWWDNGAEENNEHHFGLKVSRMDQYPGKRWTPADHMVLAFAMFTRNKAMADGGAAPPVKRMVFMSFEYGKLVLNEKGVGELRPVIEHYWGYSCCRCSQLQWGADEELDVRIQAVDLSHTQADDKPLGVRLGDEYKPKGTRRKCAAYLDMSGHNCSDWKGQRVCFDWGPHSVRKGDDGGRATNLVGYPDSPDG